MSVFEGLCLAVIAFGLVGIVLPVIPGVLLIGAAILAWAVESGTGAAWTVALVAVLVLTLGFVVKYVIPHRRLKDAGVPRRTIVVGALLGIVGFFIVPVLGLFVGFIGGVWLAEAGRVGKSNAWPSTKAALKATGLSILIELASGLIAAALFVAGVVLT